MFLTNEWYFFPSAIDKKTCNKLKKISSSFKNASVDISETISDEERKTGRTINYQVDAKSRIAGTNFTTEQWVYDLIWPYMVEANKIAGWNFDIIASESVQIARYKVGGFHTWHIDGTADCLSAYDEPNNKFLDGYARKLSMSILLNDNYEGGEFQFCTYRKQEHKVNTPEFNTCGSVIVFPSFIEHRVAPITKGKRYSLVAWFLGPPFK